MRTKLTSGMAALLSPFLLYSMVIYIQNIQKVGYLNNGAWFFPAFGLGMVSPYQWFLIIGLVSF